MSASCKEIDWTIFSNDLGLKIGLLVDISQGCLIRNLYELSQLFNPWSRKVIVELQSNSVITNSTGPSIFVRYNRDIVITVKLYVVKSPHGTKNFLKFCSL
jgi:hypothetical protein